MPGGEVERGLPSDRIGDGKTGHVDEHLDIASRLDDVEWKLWAVLAVAAGGWLLAVVAIIIAVALSP